MWCSSRGWNASKDTINSQCGVDEKGEPRDMPRVVASSLGHQALKGIQEKVLVYEARLG